MWAMAGGNEEVDTKIEEKNEKKNLTTIIIIIINFGKGVNEDRRLKQI